MLYKLECWNYAYAPYHLIAFLALNINGISKKKLKKKLPKFRRAAKTVTDASHYHAHFLVDTIETFSATITSYSLDTDVEWPFLSVPHWERRAAQVRYESFLQSFGLAPIIQDHDRDAWERYSSFKQSWLQESYNTQPYGANPIHPEDNKTAII